MMWLLNWFASLWGEWWWKDFVDYPKGEQGGDFVDVRYGNFVDVRYAPSFCNLVGKFTGKAVRAVTLGTTILMRDRNIPDMETLMEHELEHVRQYLKYGAIRGMFYAMSAKGEAEAEAAENAAKEEEEKNDDDTESPGTPSKV